MAALLECVCCKNLPRWGIGLRRTCNFGHWTGGSPGLGSYERNWQSDAAWGGANEHIFSNADRAITGAGPFTLWRTYGPEVVMTSPGLSGSGAPFGVNYSLFDEKFHRIDPVYDYDAGDIEPEPGYISIWDLSDNTIEMDNKEIISFELDGSELFPLGDKDDDTSLSAGTVVNLRYAVTPESNHMLVQVARHVSDDVAAYRSYIGEFSVVSLSSTECGIEFTSSASSSAVNLGNFLQCNPRIHESHDGDIYYADGQSGGTGAGSRFISIPGFSYNSTTANSTSFGIASRCGFVGNWYQSGSNYIFKTTAPDGDYSFTISSANLGTFGHGMSSTPVGQDPTGRSPCMMGGKWCINAKPTLSLANSTFPDLVVAFDSGDTESDGDVDLTKFVFNADFTEVERRVFWNWGPVEPGGPYVPREDGFEATSPFYYLVATLPAHETQLEDRFEDASSGFGTDPYEQYSYLVKWDTGLSGLSTLHEMHYDLSGSDAEFEIRFIDTMKTSFFSSAMAYHEVNDLTEDMITVLATGTVTYDPIDPSDITTSDNKTWSVTVRNVAGGDEGGILSLTLRADKELYGAPDDATFGNVPPRVPAVYQEFYDVPADP